MRVFFIHPLGTNLHPLRKDLHWVNSSINQQSNSSINSKFIGIWSFTIIPIMFYLELLKPWMQDVHNIVLQIWKVFVMACRCSILHSKTTSSLLFGYKKEKDGYWKWSARNLRWGSLAGDSSSIFVYSLDYAQTWLPNDAKSSMNMGEEQQFNGSLDVCKKTFATNGIAGLHRGFFGHLCW